MSVYITQQHQDLPLEGISLALQIADANGTETTMPLTYNKMMKTYDTFAAVSADRTHRVRVLITTPEVNISSG